MMMLVRPEAAASSITYWMMGLSTSGSISFGCALVAGRKRVPSPAAGKTALRILPIVSACYHGVFGRHSARVLSCSAHGGGSLLDLRFVVENRERVLERLASRGLSLEQLQATPGLAGLDPWRLDAERRAALQEVEGLRHRQRQVGEEIARIGREKGDASALKAEMKGVAERIRALDERLAEIESGLRQFLLIVPNLPDGSVPPGP